MRDTLVIIVLMLTCLAALTQAPVPEPHGIAGIVYHNNTIFQVGAGTAFKVNDTASLSGVQDVTGAGPNSGAYSVVIEGTNGDSINVSAWNISNYGRTIVTLQGDMTGIYVYLNLSRSSEANVSIRIPSNNALYNITTVFNVTANITMLGANGIRCNATIGISNTTVIILNGTETARHVLGNISLANSTVTVWWLRANATGAADITVNSTCQNDGEYFDNTNTALISNITVVDVFAPTVRLVSPPDGRVNNTHSTIIFFFNVSDFSPIANCSLMINYTINRTLYSPQRDTLLNLTSTLAQGNYSWYVNCTDTALNSNNSQMYYLFVNYTVLNITYIALTSPIYPSPGSVSIATCNATVTGAQTVNATLFSTLSSNHGSPDSNSTHYSNSSCAYGAGNYTCTFPVAYYAENATWTCNITAKSFEGNLTAANISAYLQSLLAISISPDAIDFGNVTPMNSSSIIKVNITNIGNQPLDLQLYGYGGSVDDGLAMNCSTSFIPVENERYSFNATQGYVNMTSLSGIQASPSYLNISLPKRTALITWNASYWRVMPPIMAPQNCSGTVVFTAVMDN